MKAKQKRIIYLIAFFIFLLIEVLIALFIHDDFIRPYIGDVLVVVVIYCFAKIFLPNAKMWLPIAIFILAALVETLQYFNIVELLGVEDNAFLSTLIGATFDIKDIICYGVGGLCLCLFEIIQYLEIMRCR